ncbi:MAG TPA: FAD binding domain-containing protein [Anaerolineaceae bacterium]|nr:FAD binding domain-containing protein [Anaerolineaceae bacterium]HPN50576.1 FAD binding domain-containing protein [Anaerolineaceae bacterium]
MWHEYINAASIDEVLNVLAEKGDRARIVAGGTDLVLEMERGQRKGIEMLVDVSRIAGLDQITLDEDHRLHLGPMVTHNHCVASKLAREAALPLALAAWEVGSPQIRNRGTVAGNLLTGSPANDTITPLMALGAELTLRSVRGERVVPMAQFYTGVRRTIMAPDEMLVDIHFPALRENQRGMFIKFALRRAQAISLVNAAVVLTFEGKTIRKAAITLGAVAPTIIHATEAENYLENRSLDEETIAQAAALAMGAARPISDVRGSAAYRRTMVRVVTRRALTAIMNREEGAVLPAAPVLLWGGQRMRTPTLVEGSLNGDGQAITTRINGREVTFTSGQGKTLLHLLREEGQLTGTKEGCAEGECGACTVFLDGKAVMGCLVPAPRAHGAEVMTVEGLAAGGELHPVQKAFMSFGAVQCGYCTPGFIMSAVKLLEEVPQPTPAQIAQGLTGNLCRCTGYYNIIQAVEAASKRE